MFDSIQEGSLIAKLYYKEIYRENYIMWMQLWEIEYQKSLDYFKIIQEKNKLLVKQDAVIQHSEEALATCDFLKEEYYTKLKLSLEKNQKLERWLPAMFVLGTLTGAIIRSQVSRQ